MFMCLTAERKSFWKEKRRAKMNPKDEEVEGMKKDERKGIGRYLRKETHWRGCLPLSGPGDKIIK